MATRVNLPPVSLPNVRNLPGRVSAWSSALPADRRVLAWQTLTAPWWLWSDMPVLPYPARDPALPPGGIAGDWVVDGLNRIATRIWIQRTMAIVVRGIWLTVLIGCLWLVAELLGGPALRLPIVLGLGALLVVCSVVVAALSRPTRAQTARMLDRSFGLQERISTALGNIGIEIPAEDGPASVVYLQVADAANAITLVREQSVFRLRPPARELVMAIALALALAALAFARGAGGTIPPAQSNVVPAFVPAAERFVQPETQSQSPNPNEGLSLAEVEQMVQASIDNQQDLQALADALSDHAVTRAAAELIQQGDYAAAAEELRDVANEADQLSDSARTALAQDLDNAASQMSAGNQSLSQATEQAADGLQAGGQPAQDGLRDLANSVEQSGQQVKSSEALDQAMQQAQQQGGSSNAAQEESQPGGQGEEPSSASQDGSTGAESESSGEQPSGAPGEAEANSGAEAEAGIGEDPETGAGQEGEGAPSGSQDVGPESQGGQAGAPPDGAAAGSGSDQQGDAESSDTGGSSQSSSAGSESNDQSGAEGDGGETKITNASGQPEDPAETDVSDASGEGANTSGATTDPHEAVTLQRAPDGESVQIGGSSGASSLGSGAGVSVSSGTTSQGEVGETGPESNHVPPEYRSIVESYFSDRDGS